VSQVYKFSIARTGNDAKFSSSNQSYLHSNVNTIDIQSPRRFGISRVPSLASPYIGPSNWSIM